VDVTAREMNFKRGEWNVCVREEYGGRREEYKGRRVEYRGRRVEYRGRRERGY